MPLRHRHGYAAGIHRSLRTGDMEPVVEFPEHSRSGMHRRPALIRQVRAGGFLERLSNTGSLSLHLLVLLAGPVTI